MHVEHHKWWSPSLGQDMELKVYGHYGKPVIVFPAQGGRFYEYEDFGMVEAERSFIDGGRIKLFTVDSVDNQSWANRSAHPADRARRHQDYDRYIVNEVAPFIQEHCAERGAAGNGPAGHGTKCLATGVSMGAYHAVNFFFRHPDIFNALIALSGLYQLSMFVGDYSDENVFFNTPLAYLPNLHDPWYIDQYRQSQIMVCCGQGAWEDAMLADTYTLKRILEEKQIPAWIDIWGQDVNHDWPWWRVMAPYFLEHVV